MRATPLPLSTPERVKSTAHSPLYGSDARITLIRGCSRNRVTSSSAASRERSSAEIRTMSQSGMSTARRKVPCTCVATKWASSCSTSPSTSGASSGPRFALQMCVHATGSRIAAPPSDSCGPVRPNCRA